jgi:hypothetical protein
MVEAAVLVAQEAEAMALEVVNLQQPKDSLELPISAAVAVVVVEIQDF